MSLGQAIGEWREEEQGTEKRRTKGCWESLDVDLCFACSGFRSGL